MCKHVNADTQTIIQNRKSLSRFVFKEQFSIYFMSLISADKVSQYISFISDVA